MALHVLRRFTPVSLLLFFFLVPCTGEAATRTWDNDSGNGLWSDCTNWSADSCPGSADTASFDGTNDTDSVVDSSFTGTIDAFSMAAGYTGTTTISRSLTIDNSGGYSQAGGKVKIESFNLTLSSNGSFSLTGGEFQGTSTTISLQEDVTVSGSGTIFLNTATTTFNGSTHDSTLTCTGTYPGKVNVAQTDVLGDFTLASGCAITLVNTLSTVGGLTFNGDVTTGASITGTGDHSSYSPPFTNTGNFNAAALTALNWGGNFTATDPTKLLNYTATTTFNRTVVDSTLTCTGTYPGKVDIAKTDVVGDFTLASGCAITLVNTLTTVGGITFNGDVTTGASITGSGDHASLSPAFTNTGNFNAAALTALNWGGNFTATDPTKLLNYTATTTFNRTVVDSTLTCTGTFPGKVDIAKTDVVGNFILSSGCNITLVRTISTIGSVTFNGGVDGTNLHTMSIWVSLTVPDPALLTNWTGTTTFPGTTQDSTLTCTGTYPGKVNVAQTDVLGDFILASGCAITLANNLSTVGGLTFNGDVTTGNRITGTGDHSSYSPPFTNTGNFNAAALTALTWGGNVTATDPTKLLNFTATTTFNKSVVDSTLTCTGTFPGIVDIAKTDVVGNFTSSSGCNITLVRTISTIGGITFNGGVDGVNLANMSLWMSLAVPDPALLTNWTATTTFTGTTDSTLTCTGTYPGKVNVTKTDVIGDFTLGSGCAATLVNALSTLGGLTFTGDVTTGASISITGGGALFTNTGTFNAASLTALNLTGSLTAADPTKLTNFTATTTFNGSTSDSTLTCTGTFPGRITVAKTDVIGDFNLIAGCTAESTATISTTGALTVSGTHNINQFNVSALSFTVATTGTLKLHGSNATLTAPTLSAGSTVEYTGSGSYTALKAGERYHHLKISGAGTFSTATTTTVLGDFTQTAGTWSPSAPTVFASSTSATVTTTSGTSFAGFTVNKSSIAMVAHYTLDAANLVSNVKDSSGSGNTGFLSGVTSTTTTTGQIDEALTLGGSPEYIKIPNLIQSNRSNLTISVWFKTSTTGGIIGYNIGAYPAGPSGWVPVMYVGSDGKLRAQVWDGSQHPVVTSGTVTDNAWHHAVLTVYGNGQTLYLDGSTVGSISGTIVNFSATFSQIGTAYTSSWTSGNGGWLFFNGSLDDIRMYPVALTSSQVTQLFTQQAMTHTTGTLTLAGSGVTSTSDVTLIDGTLDASTSGCSSASCNITLSGNWVGGDELFTPRSSTVSFGAGSQSITGTTTFNNLSKTVSSASSLTFGSNQTQTVQGTWTAQGSSGNLLTLAPSTALTEWKIDPQGTRTLGYLDVSYSNNVNASAITAYDLNITNSGNNTNWNFTAPPPPSISTVVEVVGGWFPAFSQSQSSLPPAPVCTLTFTPSTIALNLPTVLSWTGTGLVGGTIDEGIGAVATAGSRVIIPPPPAVGQALYTGIFTTSEGSTVYCSAVLTVVAASGKTPPGQAKKPAPVPPTPTPPPTTEVPPSTEAPPATTTPSVPLPPPEEPSLPPPPPEINDGESETTTRDIPITVAPPQGESLVVFEARNPSGAMAYAMSGSFDLCGTDIYCGNGAYQLGSYFVNQDGSHSAVTFSTIVLKDPAPLLTAAIEVLKREETRLATGATGITVGTVGVVSTIALGGHTASELPLLLWRSLMSLFLLGYRSKRQRTWGTVYDSVTKRPLDPAIVTLTREDGTVAGQAVTDLDGRFGFLVAGGTYYLKAEKSYHTFPAKEVQAIDLPYGVPYRGEPIVVPASGGVIVKDVPLDPIAFDWNEVQKYKRGLYRFFSRLDRPFAYLSFILVPVGFFASIWSFIESPTPLNLGMVAGYTLIGLLFMGGLGPRLYGLVKTTYGVPMPFARLEAKYKDSPTPAGHAVADHLGRYYLLLPKGDFTLTVAAPKQETPNESQVLEEIPIHSKGHFNKDIVVPD